MMAWCRSKIILIVPRKHFKGRKSVQLFVIVFSQCFIWFLDYRRHSVIWTTNEWIYLVTACDILTISTLKIQLLFFSHEDIHTSSPLFFSNLLALYWSLTFPTVVGFPAWSSETPYPKICVPLYTYISGASSQ